MLVSLVDGTIEKDEEEMLRCISDPFEILERLFNRLFREVI